MSVRDRLRDWLHREIQTVVAAEIDKPRLRAEDPIRTFEQNRDHLIEQLRTAANHVGAGVMVGRDVVIWGGKTTEARGLELHDGVRLYDGCRLVIDRMSAESGIVLGERVAVNFGCYIEGSGGVHIGARSILGPHVVIVSSSHRVDPSMPVQQSGKAFGAVHVGEDVWIGAGVIIRLGITIGDRAVVGAGSVVTHDVPAGATVVGNPARILRTSDG